MRFGENESNKELLGSYVEKAIIILYCFHNHNQGAQKGFFLVLVETNYKEKRGEKGGEREKKRKGKKRRGKKEKEGLSPTQ
jgi:hypothetical protein